MLEGLLGMAQAVQPQHPAIQRLCLLLEQQAAAANLAADSTSDRLSQDTAAMAILEASQVSFFLPSKSAAFSLQTMISSADRSSGAACHGPRALLHGPRAAKV